ncbi:MAG: D-aminoacyl-tRNA deacylase [Erysipelotrichaceae bacterium]|nr:D-aminoacyl-tRNA deacylase [Erysipelotrichaceae bacterium]
MRLIVQLVKESSCTIDGRITGAINKGFMVLVGFGPDDNEEITRKMAEKMVKLRIFGDNEGKMNLSLKDVDGAILSISQFTLYADCKKGNRPSFSGAMEPNKAKELYLYFNEYLRSLGYQVEEGIFGADMKIALVNDGPVTIILDSKEVIR